MILKASPIHIYIRIHITPKSRLWTAEIGRIMLPTPKIFTS